MNCHVAIILVFFIHFIYTQKVEILMPNVSTTQDDAYMCTSFKIGDDQSFITQIEPLTNMDIAHHMFAFGCEKPATTLNAWNCGSNVCEGEKSILFAWGRNAPALKLPDDVAFKVGTETKHRYIVVNIHYLNKVKNDVSGVAITFSNKPRPNLGGIMIMVTGDINIPPKAKNYHSDISCKYEGRTINVFAFRVHAHVHGDVNTAYRIRNHEWKKVAKGDPQWPQAFYPTNNPIEIKDGDILVGRCVYHNDENRYVTAGATHSDEMCNIYLMYYSDSEENIPDTCAGSSYESLENTIPDESYTKPPSPLKDGDSPTIHTHHDMEGSKLHSLSDKKPIKSPLLSSLFNNYGYKQKQPQQLEQPLLEDYYDDVERSRSKDRYEGADSFDYNGGGGNNQAYDSGGSFLDADDFVDYPGLDPSSTSSLYAAALKAQKSNLINKLSNGGRMPQNNNKPKISISKYTLLNNWYDSSKVKIGQVGGLAVDAVRGNLIIFHRGGQVWQGDSFSYDFLFNMRKYTLIQEDTIIAMNRNTGKVVKSWGANMFFMPHGVTVDPMGNVWVTDVGRHQVLKFNYDDTSKPALEVGERNKPGRDKEHFCQPSDVAVLKSGEFYVADGYCNSRVVKFDRNGKFLMEWSSEDPGRFGHFYIPHALALHEANSVICVADRENYRVQCFDLNGNFMHESNDKEYGPIYGVSFASNNGSVLYAINGFAADKEKQFEKKILLIQVTDGSIMGTINLDQSEVNKPHMIALNSDASEIYIGTLDPPKVVKYAYLSFTIDSQKRKNSTAGTFINKKVDGDSDNFRTSMFIMAFLAIPLTAVIIAAIIIRLKNAGKLRNVSSMLKETKPSDISKWMKSTATGGKNGVSGKHVRNGFTRLNQDSDNENEPLDNHSDSDDSDEITVPLSKA